MCVHMCSGVRACICVCVFMWLCVCTSLKITFVPFSCFSRAGLLGAVCPGTARAVCVCVCVCVGVDVITVALDKVTAKPSQFLWCCLGNLYASATHEIKDFYLIHFLKECIE